MPHAAFALLEGDTEEAERLATAALEVGTAGGEPDAVPFYGIQLMRTRDAQGRLGELESLIAESAGQNPTIPALRAALAAAHLDAGDEAAARELIDGAAALSFSLPDDSAWFDAMVNYARVVIELRLHPHDEALIDLLDPFRDQVPHNALIPQPPVATYLGGLATVAEPLRGGRVVLHSGGRPQRPWRDEVRGGVHQHAVGSNAPNPQRARRCRPSYGTP